MVSLEQGRSMFRLFFLFFRVLNRDSDQIELDWKTPSETYGDLLGYRIIYGIKNQTLKEQYVDGNHHVYRITDLGMIIFHYDIGLSSCHINDYRKTKSN